MDDKSYESGDLVAVEHFDFGAIDRALLDAGEIDEADLTPEELREIHASRSSNAADVMRELISQMFPATLQGSSLAGRLRPGALQVIGLRFVALAWILQIEGVGERPLSEIGALIGTSKAVLSYHVRTLNRIFGVSARGQKDKSSRAGYAFSTAEAWRTGRRKAKPKREIVKIENQI